MQEPKQLDLELDKSDDDIDENSGVLVDEHIKIFDPNTNEVLVNKRGEE